MPSIFQYYVWFSLTFPWLFQSVQNSLTFPWLENAFPFFQVFQFFQSEWEPCIRRYTSCGPTLPPEEGQRVLLDDLTAAGISLLHQQIIRTLFLFLRNHRPLNGNDSTSNPQTPSLSVCMFDFFCVLSGYFCLGWRYKLSTIRPISECRHKMTVYCLSRA